MFLNHNPLWQTRGTPSRDLSTCSYCWHRFMTYLWETCTSSMTSRAVWLPSIAMVAYSLISDIMKNGVSTGILCEHRPLINILVLQTTRRFSRGISTPLIYLGKSEFILTRYLFQPLTGTLLLRMKLPTTSSNLTILSTNSISPRSARNIL
jgi:hypothetical protein